MKSRAGTAGDDDGMRLDRLLANLGYGSRQEVRGAVLSGRVRLGPTVVRDPGLAVTDATEVRFEGLPLDDIGPLLVAFHKPPGAVCSHDTREGPRVYDHLPPRWLARNPQVTTIGRLDKDTSGLLLITDDHALVHAMTSPKRHVTKRYRATLDRPADTTVVERFASGALLLDGEQRPCAAAVLEPIDDTTADVVLEEGRYHQVRRMFAACGLHVISLHRTTFGPYALGDLAPAAWERVAPPGSV
jgi:16S rRNA pseudouridine516 synthase